MSLKDATFMKNSLNFDKEGKRCQGHQRSFKIPVHRRRLGGGGVLRLNPTLSQTGC